MPAPVNRFKVCLAARSGQRQAESLFENSGGSVRRVFLRPGASVMGGNIPDSVPHDLLPGSRKSLGGPPPPHFQAASETSGPLG